MGTKEVEFGKMVHRLIAAHIQFEDHAKNQMTERILQQLGREVAQMVVDTTSIDTATAVRYPVALRTTVADTNNELWGIVIERGTV